jgi:hypothetical protein
VPLVLRPLLLLRVDLVQSLVFKKVVSLGTTISKRNMEMKKHGNDELSFLIKLSHV